MMRRILGVSGGRRLFTIEAWYVMGMEFKCLLFLVIHCSGVCGDVL
jgi:hypothetical protein